METKRRWSRKEVETLVREAPARVVDLVLAMQTALREVREEVARQQARVAELEEQNRPPSAPHRRRAEERVAQPKKPGRAAGHPGTSRPMPKEIDVVVEVPLTACPHCQGAVETQPLDQYLEDLPARRPHVTHLRTFEGHCPRCQRWVRSTHPQQTSTAGGCAGVQLGPRALAVAAELKHDAGLTLRKVVRVLALLGGLKISPGGLAQAFGRMAGKLAGEETRLQRELLAAPVIHTDETSWWLNGPYSLWVFTTPGTSGLTLYQVVAHRDRATFQQTVPPDWPGLLVSDCLSVYDGVTARQHKCYAHHLKAWRLLRPAPVGGVTVIHPWVAAVRSFFAQAQRAKAHWPHWSPGERQGIRVHLETQADHLFARPRGDPAQARFRNRIAKQRDHLLSFLDEPLAEATNNLAERQLRGAVIARKVSCGNKTLRGAATWQLLASLAATCRQRAQDFAAFLLPRLLLPPSG